MRCNGMDFTGSVPFILIRIGKKVNFEAYIIGMKEEKVILTGTLEALPDPFLDKKERTIACRLKVKPSMVCFVERLKYEKGGRSYIVEVQSPVQNIIYETAYVADRVLVFGQCDRARHIQDAHLIRQHSSISYKSQEYISRTS